MYHLDIQFILIVLFINSSFYRGEDCMKRFCKDLKDHAIKIIDFKKKTMIPLTKEEDDGYNKENTCYICKKDFNNDTTESSSLERKVRDHCHFTDKYRGAAHNTCNLRYEIPNSFRFMATSLSK